MLDLFDPLTVSSLLQLSDSSSSRQIEPEDVKAGYTALLLWLAMAVAVGLLGWSLVRQLRKTQAAKDAGVYGEDRKITKGPAFSSDDSEPRD